MRFRELCGPVLLATLSMVGGTAIAQEPPAAPPPGAAEPPAAEPPAAAAPAAAPAMAAEGGAAAVASKMRVGLNVVPMPFGKVKISAPLVGSTSLDTAFAFGVFPFFDYLLTPNFFIGVAPQYTFNLKAKDASGDAAKELDLMLRVGGGGYVVDKLQLYGYVSPGYSIVMPPSGGGSDPKGFMVGIHAGAMYDIAPTAFLNLEIGYQLGFQSVSDSGFTADFKTNLAQIGLGGGIRF